MAAAAGGGRFVAPEPEPISPVSPNNYSPSIEGSAANDNASSLSAPSIQSNALSTGPAIRPVEGFGADPTSLDLPINLRARANHDRTPQSAVFALLDDPYFGEWLSNQKKNWKEIEQAYPEGVKDAKADAAQVLAREAFGTLMAYTRESSEDKREAAFNTILPYATELVNRPYEPGEEYRFRPEAKFLKPNPRLADITGLVDNISFGLPTAFGGRPGSEQMQAHIAELKTRLVEALKRCGAKIMDERSGKRERQIPGPGDYTV